MLRVALLTSFQEFKEPIELFLHALYRRITIRPPGSEVRGDVGVEAADRHECYRVDPPKQDRQDRDDDLEDDPR